MFQKILHHNDVRVASTDYIEVADTSGKAMTKHDG